MDLGRFFDGVEPMYYDLSTDHFGDLLVRVHPAFADFFDGEAASEYFERAEAEDVFGLKAWKLCLPACEKKQGCSWNIDHEKGHGICCLLTDLLLRHLSFPEAGRWDPVLEMATADSPKQYINVSTASGPPDRVLSRYSFGGWLSLPFVAWMQSEESQELDVVRLAIDRAYTRLLPSLRRTRGVGASATLGGEECFKIDFGYHGGTCMSTKYNCRHEIDVGNVNSSIDLIVGVCAFAAICGVYQREALGTPA